MSGSVSLLCWTECSTGVLGVKVFMAFELSLLALEEVQYWLVCSCVSVCFPMWKDSFPSIFVNRCQIMCFYCFNKHHDQKQLGGERVYLAYSPFRECRTGTHSRIVAAETEEGIPCSVHFLSQPRSTYVGVVPSTVGYALPFHINP